MFIVTSKSKETGGASRRPLSDPKIVTLKLNSRYLTNFQGQLLMSCPVALR